MRIRRTEQQAGLLCPVRLLFPANLLRTGRVLCPDVLLHSFRVLRPAAPEE